MMIAAIVAYRAGVHDKYDEDVGDDPKTGGEPDLSDELRANMAAIESSGAKVAKPVGRRKRRR